MSTQTIGYGPYKGPDRFGAGSSGGGTGTVIDPGTGNPTPSPKPTDATLTIPGLTLTTSTGKDARGRLVASVRAQWSAPSAGEHDTDPYRIGFYEISYSTRALPGWTPNSRTEVRDVTIRNLPVERDIDVRVRAVANAGIRGPWLQGTVRTARDNTPPPVPSKPTVIGTLKGATITWDGLFVGGAPVPDDFTRVEAHLSLDPNFAPSQTIVLQLGDKESSAGAQFPSARPPFKVYGRIRAMDDSGNLSVFSEVAEGSSIPVLEGDIGQAAVTTAALAQAAVNADKILQGAVKTFHITDGAVTTNTLADLAITTAKIGDRAVDGLKVAIDAIKPENLVDNAVIASKLAPLSVLSDKLAENAVVLGKIGPSAVDNLALLGGSVSTDKVARNAITDELLAAFAVKARAVGFDVGGANQLENSSWEDRDAPLGYWRADGNLTMAVVDGNLIHGTRSLRTTFDSTQPAAPALTP